LGGFALSSDEAVEENLFLKKLHVHVLIVRPGSSEEWKRTAIDPVELRSTHHGWW